MTQATMQHKRRRQQHEATNPGKTQKKQQNKQQKNKKYKHIV
jgi:hypothetical protein